jgi:hypothetical protein
MFASLTPPAVVGAAPAGAPAGAPESATLTSPPDVVGVAPLGAPASDALPLAAEFPCAPGLHAPATTVITTV